MIKKFKIDLSDCSGYIDGQEDDTIQKELIKNHLFNDSYLYSVFNGNRTKQVEKTGNYREGNPESIFAFKQSELVWETDKGSNDIKSLCRNYKKPAIAIYDLEKFEQEYSKGTAWEYHFKNPDKKLEALVGIALLKF